MKTNLMSLAALICILASSSAWSIELKRVSIEHQGRNIDIIALPSGMTVYVFDPDLKDGKTHCIGDCAEKWPPVALSEKEAKEILDGADPELLTAVKRPNGLYQLAYKKRLLYTYYQDRLSGDVIGDGLGKVWHLIEADSE